MCGAPKGHSGDFTLSKYNSHVNTLLSFVQNWPQVDKRLLDKFHVRGCPLPQAIRPTGNSQP